MAYAVFGRIFSAGLLTVIVVSLSAVSAEAAVQKPDCGALEKWAMAIDSKDRWQPIPGNRSWLPRAFDGAGFEALFGAAALDWEESDPPAIGDLLNSCAQQARKAKRYDEQKALNQARNFMIGRLKPLLAQAKSTREQQKAAQQEKPRAQDSTAQNTRQKQVETSRSKPARAKKDQRSGSPEALSAALDEMLGLPDSPELLRGLAMLRAVDFDDPESYGQTYGRVGLRAARKLLQALRNVKSDIHDPRVAPRLEERYQALHDAEKQRQLGEIDGLDNSLRSLQVLDRKLTSLRADMGMALSSEDEAEFDQSIAKKRTSIQIAIVARAKSLIDDAGNDVAAIRSIEKIMKRAADVGLTREQINDDLRPYARARQEEIGDGVLDAAAKNFADYPGSLEGLSKIQHFIKSSIGSIMGRASRPALKRFGQAASQRLSAIAREAFPEFERELAALPVTSAGLQVAETSLKTARSLPEVDAEVRSEYVAAAQARRGAIATALAVEREKERQKAIDAGGDPALVGYTFMESNTGSKLEFRDERRVFFAMIGMKFAGTYEVSRDDVIVEGPNGTLVFTRSGDQLNGMGLTFQRAQ